MKDAVSKSYVDAMMSGLDHRESVATFADLPTDAEVGWHVYIEDTQAGWVCIKAMPTAREVVAAQERGDDMVKFLGPCWAQMSGSG